MGSPVILTKSPFEGRRPGAGATRRLAGKPERKHSMPATLLVNRLSAGSPSGGRRSPDASRSEPTLFGGVGR